MRAEPIGRHSLRQLPLSHPRPLVVPAKAGTHNHRCSLLHKPSTNVPKEKPRRMGPCFRRDDISFAGTTTDIKDSSTARGAGLRKAPADAHRQGVADFAIGLKLLLTIAVGSGRIMGWPVCDVGCKLGGQFQRLVWRPRARV